MHISIAAKNLRLTKLTHTMIQSYGIYCPRKWTRDVRKRGMAIGFIGMLTLGRCTIRNNDIIDIYLNFDKNTIFVYVNNILYGHTAKFEKRSYRFGISSLGRGNKFQLILCDYKSAPCGNLSWKASKGTSC